MTQAISVLFPNRVIDKKTLSMLVAAQVIFFALVWVFSPFVLLPTPGEVAHNFSVLWAAGLGTHLITSFVLNLEAIAASIIVSLLLSYLTVIPLFRPIVGLASKLRFLSMVGLSVAFAVTFRTGHQVKLAMLTFSISVFFVTSMLDVLSSIPREQFDLARTLRMGEWRVVYEVVVLGQIDKVFDCLRQNVAIGWMMLTMVESVVFSEGGVGTVLMTQQHHQRLGGIMAIQLTILFLGLGQDYAIGALKNLFCPYANLMVEKR